MNVKLGRSIRTAAVTLVISGFGMGTLISTTQAQGLPWLNGGQTTQSEPGAVNPFAQNSVVQAQRQYVPQLPAQPAVRGAAPAAVVDLNMRFEKDAATAYAMAQTLQRMGYQPCFYIWLIDVAGRGYASMMAGACEALNDNAESIKELRKQGVDTTQADTSLVFVGTYEQVYSYGKRWNAAQVGESN